MLADESACDESDCAPGEDCCCFGQLGDSTVDLVEVVFAAHQVDPSRLITLALTEPALDPVAVDLERHRLHGHFGEGPAPWPDRLPLYLAFASFLC